MDKDQVAFEPTSPDVSVPRCVPFVAIDDADDFDRVSQKFRAFNGSILHIVKFERIFLDDTSDIKKMLQYLELSKFMQVNAGRQVLVTKKGLMVL